MIHHSCDCCKRMLDSSELRYVVKMEIYAAMDPAANEDLDDDRDHLQEIQDILQRAENDPDMDADDMYEELRYDLCPECHRKFVKNPLGLGAVKQFDFSKN